MCSRYVPADPLDAKRVFKARLALPKEYEFKPVTYPGYQAPVVLLSNTGERKIESRFWGLVTRIPGKKDPSKLLERVMQNAVSETVDEKRTFKSAWAASRRCIIPAVSFMEPKDKQFVPIHDPEQELLAIAGIWGPTTYKGVEHDAYTMLTCEPNSFMEKFHDRMPVILAPDGVEEWLSPDTTPEQAKKLCRPYGGQLKLSTGGSD